MTQKTLAEKTGLSRTSITNSERGGQALMVHQLLELAKALGVSPTNLIQSVKISEERGDQKPVPEEMKVLLDRLEKTTSRSRSR